MGGGEILILLLVLVVAFVVSAAGTVAWAIWWVARGTLRGVFGRPGGWEARQARWAAKRARREARWAARRARWESRQLGWRTRWDGWGTGWDAMGMTAVKSQRCRRDRCGAENPGDARFCRRCGTPLTFARSAGVRRAVAPHAARV